MHWQWIIAGRVPLGLAWFIAFLVSIAVIQLVANTLAGTALDSPVFWGLILLPSLAIPVIARRKRRRLLVWGGIAAGLFGIGVLQPFFQPLTGLLAIVLASPGSVPPPPPDPAEIAARDEQIATELRQVAERLSALELSADALSGSEVRSYETEISGIRGGVFAIAEPADDQIRRVRALMVGSVNGFQSAANRAMLVADLITQHPEIVDTEEGRHYNKAIKETEAMRQEISIASAYLDEANVHLKALQRRGQTQPPHAKLQRRAPASDPGPDDLRGQRSRPERGRRKPRY